MLWVLKRTVSLRRFFWAPKTYVLTDSKKIITILWSDNLIIWTYNAYLHTGKGKRRFASIYSYYRYFIERMW